MQLIFIMHIFFKYFKAIKNNLCCNTTKRLLKKMSENEVESLSKLDISKEDVVDKETENKKREAFGNRHLTDNKDAFEFNAW